MTVVDGLEADDIHVKVGWFRWRVKCMKMSQSLPHPACNYFSFFPVALKYLKVQNFTLLLHIINREVELSKNVPIDNCSANFFHKSYLLPIKSKERYLYPL